MAKPRQTKLSISYDGTAVQTVTTTSSGSGSSSGGGTYTVVNGDTLWAISKKYYGSGKYNSKIYDANTDLIESTAKAHGKASSDNGHWIWAGEVLTIPELESSSGSTTTTTSVQTVRTGTADSSLGTDIAEHATAFTYTDVASGESDSISITMSDINKEWIGSKKPQRGSSLGAGIVLTNWDSEGEQTFDCGTFTLDDISFSGRPLTCVLGGVSVPAMDDFKSCPKTKTWEKTTIEQIANEIGSSAGVAVYYDADTIQIKEIEQNKKTDSAFLYSLCEQYGLVMKVYNSKIVIFDAVAYEEKDSVATLSESDMISWIYNNTIEGTYTGVNIGYTDPDTDESINLTMGESGRTYHMNTQASSKYDAQLQAAAKVNEANRSIETMTVTIRARIGIVASQNITIADLGGCDGKYYIDKIVHSIGTNGYRMQLTIHKVQTPIKVTAPAATASSVQTYTVVSGDTLWAISKKYYGTGTKYGLIYDANADLIESTAKAHGKASSSGGHWIWPGEVFTIPAEE